jgi:hypothetical protein
MSAANRDASRNERQLPPFPTKQMFVLGMSSTFMISALR